MIFSKTLTATALTCVLLLNSTVIVAQEKPTGVTEAAPIVAPSKKGQPALLDGVTLSPEAVAATITQQELLKQQAELSNNFSAERCGIEKDHALREQKIASDADQKIAAAQIESAKKDNAQLQAALKKEVEDRPNVMLWALGGGLIGVALTTAIMIVVKQK